jgi:hypothetical protein
MRRGAANPERPLIDVGGARDYADRNSLIAGNAVRSWTMK